MPAIPGSSNTLLSLLLAAGLLWGNLAPQIVEQANQRRSYDVRVVQPESLAEQQKIADAFFNEGLLPTRIDARDVVLWKPEASR